MAGKDAGGAGRERDMAGEGSLHAVNGGKHGREIRRDARPGMNGTGGRSPAAGGRSRWQPYIDAAVNFPSVDEPGGERVAGGVVGPGNATPEAQATQQPGTTVRLGRQFAADAAGSLGRRLRAESARAKDVRQRRAGRRRRTDLRLVLPALFVWGTAVAGNWLPPSGLAGLCAGIAVTAGILLFIAGRAKVRRTGASIGNFRQASIRRASTGRPSAGQGSVSQAPRPAPGTPGSLYATLAVAMLLALVAGAHAALDASRRHDGPIAEAVAARATLVAELEVAGAPRRLGSPGTGRLADRWAIPVTLKVVAFDGRTVAGDTRFVVMGGTAWEHVLPGQRMRTTGKVRPAAPGEPEAGILAASSEPTVLRDAGPWQQGPGELRRGFTSAAAHFGGDAAGLLPGMVTGDTTALNPDLDFAMKTVGMTHLTAVSGANCSLVLGTLLLAARTLRLPRPAAAVASLAGLGLFVLMVGPDASVLRAALMGSIGLAAVAFGRAARGLSLLCVAVIGLLLGQPLLATSFGFLLSVLATLGIVVTGRPIMDWMPSSIPRWAAAGVAVPLSAQLFCSPAIVLLQPQFSTYALPANVLAAALVAPVTLLGTAAAALLTVFPAAADLLMATAAPFATAVAAVSRFFASLPGAALPWPEGGFGAATAGLYSAIVLAAVWLALHPAAAVGAALAAHAQTVAVLERRRQPAPLSAAREAARSVVCRGLERWSGHGTLRVHKPTSGRNHKWLLPRPNGPGPRRRTAPPGGR